MPAIGQSTFRISVGMLLTLSVVSPASAQADCQAISDDVKRLKCYDEQTNALPTIRDSRLQRTEAQQGSKREIKVSLISKRTRASTAPFEAVSFLNMQCKDNTTTAWITFVPRVTFGDRKTAEVVLRADDKPGRAFNFQVTPQGLSLPRGRAAIPFVRAIEASDVATLSTLPDDKLIATGQFDSSGVEEAIKELRALCNW